MNRDEERQLREMERSLARDDPTFAERIGAAAPAGERTMAACGTAVAVSGCALALLGLLSGSAFGVLGVLIAVVGFALRLTLPTASQVTENRGNDDGEPGTGHDGARI